MLQNCVPSDSNISTGWGGEGRKDGGLLWHGATFSQSLSGTDLASLDLHKKDRGQFILPVEILLCSQNQAATQNVDKILVGACLLVLTYFNK